MIFMIFYDEPCGKHSVPRLQIFYTSLQIFSVVCAVHCSKLLCTSQYVERESRARATTHIL